MTVKNNQLELPFTQADSDKLDGITPGAQPQPSIASQAEAEAGLDNGKMMTPLRVLESIQANAGSGSGASISGSFKNMSGSSIPALSIVAQDSSGNLIPVVTNSSSIVNEILGVLTATTANSATGTVVFDGLIPNIATSFNVGDVLYLDSDGTLTSTIPDYGFHSFAAGYAVVKVGKITKNFSNPSNKDFLVQIQNLGTL